MKRQIIDAIIIKLKHEQARQHRANTCANDGARFSAANASKQRDTTGFEAAYLARGYAVQHQSLAHQIDELNGIDIEDFSGQEIDIGALVEVELNEEPAFYFLLNCGGGSEIQMNGQTITVITPESPVGQALMGHFECEFFSFRPGVEGLILSVN